jgi:hypothetical protein
VPAAAQVAAELDIKTAHKLALAVQLLRHLTMVELVTATLAATVFNLRFFHQLHPLVAVAVAAQVQLAATALLRL